MKYLIILLFLISDGALAHPTSYSGSLSLMSMNNSHKRTNTIHYSPTYWSSFGMTSVTKDDAHFYYPRVGLLLKRWNRPNSQGNIYAFGGYGKVDWKNDLARKDSILNYGAQADWEDRRYFIMGKYNRMENSDYLDDMYMARIGYAPYIAKYSELNAWLMLQFMYHPRDEDKNMLTPMVRMFYKNILWEFGASTNGDWMLNFTIRQFL